MSLLDISNHGEVYRACKPVSDQWRPLGMMLGLDKPTLDYIQASYTEDDEKCMSEVIARWLRLNIKEGVDLPSWRTLCVALSHINKPRLAETISLEHMYPNQDISEDSDFIDQEEGKEQVRDNQDGDHHRGNKTKGPLRPHNHSQPQSGHDNNAALLAVPSSLTTPPLQPPSSLVTTSKDELNPLNIIKYLKRAPHFTVSAHWTLLLRLLGVPTSDVHKSIIDAKIDSDIHHHLEDCLDVLLKQDESQSWQKIDDAVKYITEHEKATVVFRLLWPEIVSILMDEVDDVMVQLVIGRLEAENIIDGGNHTVSMDQLFDFLHSFIEKNPIHNLLKLFNTLTNHFVFFRKLKSLFEIECNLSYLELIRPTHTHNIPLSPLLKGEFDDVIQKYNNLTTKIIDSICERLTSETKLDLKLRKRLVSSGECEPMEEDCDTMKLLQEYIKASSSVINTKRLKSLCEKFGSPDILKKIEKYEKRRQELCNTLTADKLIGKSLSMVTTMECNTITFTVKWDVRKTKMNQIEELLYLAFSNCGSAIHVTNIKETNSFTVTCYSSEAIVGLLIHKAQKNLSLLKEKGVIFFKIGYCTLLDHKRKYEINTEFIYEEQLTKHDDSVDSKLMEQYTERLHDEGGSHSYNQEKKRSMKPFRTLSKELAVIVKSRKKSGEETQSLKVCTESRVPTLHYGSQDYHCPPIDILMDQYSEHYLTHEHWYSPPFYTHPEGYKLCIKMVPSGQDRGEGTHLSMFVNVMSGDNDSQLPWPFMGVIDVQLRNQRGDYNHLNSTIVYDKSTDLIASGQVVDGSGARTPSGTAALVGKGYAQWIRNEDLQYNPDDNTQYLKNDAVIVRVNGVILDDGSWVSSPPGVMRELSTEYVAELRVPNFNTLKRNSKSWESDGFYTGPNESGYKFLLAVHPNGKHRYKGERVSVYVHLMKGKNDNTLRFPFRGTIAVQLVNQRENKNHVEHLIKYTNEDDQYGWFGGRVYMYSFVNLYYGRSYPFGCPGFVEHENLSYNQDNNTQYLTENNELVFRITDIKLL